MAKFIGSGATAAARLKRGLLGTKAGLKPRALRDKLGGRLGGGAGGNGKATDAVGTKTPKGTVEDGVAQSAGTGATSGLPTVGADGVISMNLHQVGLHESSHNDWLDKELPSLHFPQPQPHNF